MSRIAQARKTVSRLLSILTALAIIFGTTTTVMVTGAMPAHADTGGYPMV